MSKNSTTNTERVERQRLKELEAFRLDKKAIAAMKKELDTYPTSKIERHSGALSCRLGGKP